MPQMTREQRQLGRIELMAIGQEINEDLVEYAKWVGEWALRTQRKHQLSNEGLSMLLDCAPRALVMSIAAVNGDEPNDRG